MLAEIQLNHPARMLLGFYVKSQKRGFLSGETNAMRVDFGSRPEDLAGLRDFCWQQV